MSDAYCQPEWHDGGHMEADFMLLTFDRGTEEPLTSQWATCRNHVEQAVRECMIREAKTVVVVRALGRMKDELRRRMETESAQ